MKLQVGLFFIIPFVFNVEPLQLLNIKMLICFFTRYKELLSLKLLTIDSLVVIPEARTVKVVEDWPFHFMHCSLDYMMSYEKV